MSHLCNNICNFFVLYVFYVPMGLRKIIIRSEVTMLTESFLRRNILWIIFFVIYASILYGIYVSVSWRGGGVVFVYISIIYMEFMDSKSLGVGCLCRPSMYVHICMDLYARGWRIDNEDNSSPSFNF